METKRASSKKSIALMDEIKETVVYTEITARQIEKLVFAGMDATFAHTSVGREEFKAARRYAEQLRLAAQRLRESLRISDAIITVKEGQHHGKATR